MDAQEIEKKDILAYLLSVLFGSLLWGILCPMGHWAIGYLLGFIFLLCCFIGIALFPRKEKRKRRLHQSAALILAAPFILTLMMIVIDKI